MDALGTHNQNSGLQQCQSCLIYDDDENGDNEIRRENLECSRTAQNDDGRLWNP